MIIGKNYTIDLVALGIELEPGVEYSFRVNSGFMFDNDNQDENVNFNFLTYTTTPVLVAGTRNPYVPNQMSITLDFNASIYYKTGSIKLYDSLDTLIQTWGEADLTPFNGTTQIVLDLDDPYNQLEDNTSYKVVLDNNMFITDGRVLVKSNSWTGGASQFDFTTANDGLDEFVSFLDPVITNVALVYTRIRNSSASINVTAAVGANIKQYNFLNELVTNYVIADTLSRNVVYGFQEQYIVSKNEINSSDTILVLNTDGSLHSTVSAAGTDPVSSNNLEFAVTQNYLLVKEYKANTYNYISLYKKQATGDLFTLVETLSLGSTEQFIRLHVNASDSGFMLARPDLSKIQVYSISDTGITLDFELSGYVNMSPLGPWRGTAINDNYVVYPVESDEYLTIFNRSTGGFIRTKNFNSGIIYSILLEGDTVFAMCAQGLAVYNIATQSFNLLSGFPFTPNLPVSNGSRIAVKPYGDRFISVSSGDAIYIIDKASLELIKTLNFTNEDYAFVNYDVLALVDTNLIIRDDT